MPIEDVKGKRYRCDGCDFERIVPDGGDPPSGTYGTVREITETGGSYMVDWYAHRTSCIYAAIKNAIRRAWDGSSDE